MKRIRVVSYNVHACVGMDGSFQPRRIADVLARLNADFIALQEVEERRHAGTVVSAYLADKLGMTIAGRSTHNRAGIDFGNLLLSTAEPVRTDTHDIAFEGREPRAIIDAAFAIGAPCRELRVLTTHFGLAAAERRSQLARLLRHIENADVSPVVVCADFNEWRPYSGLHRTLGRVLGVSPSVRSFPSRLPTLALDRIYASRPASVTRLNAVSSRIARIASDHLPIVADIEIRQDSLES